jgi:outer membrane receptor protein involved in Fe transport
MKKFIPILFLVLVSYNGLAQNDTTQLDTLSLKELLNVKVTTASRSVQNSEKAPATVHVVSQEQIRMRGYQSLLNLITDLPDMKVDDKIYADSRNSITVRGIQGQQNFVILLNGVKISSPTNEAVPIMENYPVNLAEQVEVMYGPASALYGADAVSGVINIITKKLPASKDLIAEANVAAGNYGYTNNTLFLAKRLTVNSNIVISGQYNYDSQPDYTKVYPDDPQLSGEPYRTGVFNTVYGPVKPLTPFKPSYQAPTLAYNIYTALNVSNFSFSLFTNHARIPSAYGNNTSNTIYNKDVYMGQSVTTANASFKRKLNKFFSSTSLTASGYSIDPESSYRNLYTALEPVYKYSSSTSIKAEEQLDFKASSKLNLTGGASYENFNAIPQSADLSAPVNTSRNIQGSIAGTSSFYHPDGLPAQFYYIKYYNVSTYLQAQYRPAKTLAFTLGSRYDYNSRYGSSINPRLGAVFSPTPKTTIKALYGSAYLAPSPSTAYVQYGTFETADSGKTYHSPFLHLPNPGIKPIRSHNFEVNIRHYITNDFTVTADAYYTVLNGLFGFADDNLTTRLYQNQYNGMPVDYIEVFTNQGRQKNYGGSLQFNLKHSIATVLFNSYASFSYVDGKSDRAELPFISPNIFHAGTDMHAGNLTFSPRLLIMSKQNLPGAKDTLGTTISRQKIAGYALLNLSTRYQFSKKFSLFVNASNALNQHYRSVGYNMDLNKKDTELFYGQPQDPFRIMGGLNFRF